MDNYYIYIYYRLDTNEPFYIGKGKNNRWKRLDREYNPHFMNILNKYKIAVVIEKDNLTEEQADDMECWLIHELVFKYGYSIDIPNNRSIEKGRHLVNMTWGGEGVSGMNSWENMTEEAKIERRRKTSKNHTNVEGENNPFFGKKHSKKSTEKMSKSRSGKNNYKAESVICLTTKKIFFTMKEASNFYNIDSSSLSKCCRGERKTCGKLFNNTPLIWRKIIWNHNKKYRIKK